jgi:hypothetical protein
MITRPKAGEQNDDFVAAVLVRGGVCCRHFGLKVGWCELRREHPSAASILRIYSRTAYGNRGHSLSNIDGVLCVKYKI